MQVLIVVAGSRSEESLLKGHAETVNQLFDDPTRSQKYSKRDLFDQLNQPVHVDSDSCAQNIES